MNKLFLTFHSSVSGAIRRVLSSLGLTNLTRLENCNYLTEVSCTLQTSTALEMLIRGSLGLLLLELATEASLRCELSLADLSKCNEF